jgi:hypothetical protein
MNSAVNRRYVGASPSLPAIFMKKIVKSEWSLKKPRFIKKGDKRYKKAVKQLKTYGFAYDETWGLDQVILEFALPRLKHFRKVVCNYPYGLTMESWTAIIDKMIEGIEIYLEDSWDERSKEGMDLFFKYFHHLWW